uniref:Uncharacterized protein n=1 Tax=Mustela putorius furo TaxID=9669 RepID=M3Y5U6_MUSPF
AHGGGSRCPSLLRSCFARGTLSPRCPLVPRDVILDTVRLAPGLAPGPSALCPQLPPGLPGRQGPAPAAGWRESGAFPGFPVPGQRATTEAPPPGPPPRPPLTAGCGQAVPVVSLCQEAPPRSSGCGSQSIRKARVLATKHQSKANQLTENLQDECRQGPGAPHARLCGPERRGLLRFAPSAPSPEETVGLQAPGTRLVGASDPGAAAGNGPTRGAVAEGARGRCPRAGPPAARSARVTAVRLDPGADAAAAGRTHRRAGGARVPDEGPCRRGLRKTQGSVHAASYSPASTGGAELDASWSSLRERRDDALFAPWHSAAHRIDLGRLVCLVPRSAATPETAALALPLGREDSQPVRRHTHSLEEQKRAPKQSREEGREGSRTRAKRQRS